MTDRFVSEKQLEEARKTRQEEWEKVRSPDQPQEAPEPEVDHRPLYERLREQKEKIEHEKEEAKQFKNMVRGLDSEEIGFLDFVDSMKSAEEKKRREEENKILADMQQTVAEAPDPTAILAEISPKSVNKPSSSKVTKQAQLLTGAIKRKRTSEDDSSDATREKQSKLKDEQKNNESSDGQIKGKSEREVDESPQSDDGVMYEMGIRPTTMNFVGVLPGLADYSGSSSEEEENDDVTSTTTTNVTVGGGTGVTQSMESDKSKRFGRSASTHSTEKSTSCC